MTTHKIKQISTSGPALLRDPLLNKGSAFTPAERDAFELHGLLPYKVLDIEMQAKRVYALISRYPDNMGKYVALASLQDRNEHLYFYLLQQHLEEFLPIVYTPTIGMATQKFSHVFQRGRGAWITPDQSGSIIETLRDAAQGRDIRLIVATDNESILGIGDQGVGGIKVSIGKLSLYTAAAGIDPASVLPISLDVGTENLELRNDPAYLGWPESRLRGKEYEALVDEFVAAVKQEFPHALVQWEDFRKDNALRIMDRYRQEVLSFNDDIQGTGAVTLAGILSAERVHGRKLANERILILGAGAAGLGIARQIRAAMQAEGLDGEALQKAIAVLDSRGLIIDDGTISEGYKKELAWTPEQAAALEIGTEHRDMMAVCEQFKPTVLIGTSGQAGAFNENIVRKVASYTERPVILPLSNPTDQSEAIPADIYEWTEGRALVAAGSPFPEINYGGKIWKVGQGNNAFIFPGVGLGAILGQVSEITDTMFYAAAQALADAVSEEELQAGLLYPAVSRLREVSGKVAEAVIGDAIDKGLIAALTEREISQLVEAGRWSSAYPTYERAPD